MMSDSARPSSPIAGMAEPELAPEPFPDFVDLTPKDSALHNEPSHCIRHCKETVCVDICLRSRRVPVCRCKGAPAQLDWTKFEAPPGPKYELSHSSIENVHQQGKKLNGEQQITLYLPDIAIMLGKMNWHHLRKAIATDGLHDALNAALPLCSRNRYPAHCATVAVQTFFDCVKNFFVGVLRYNAPNGVGYASVDQLRSDLDIIADLALQELIHVQPTLVTFVIKGYKVPRGRCVPRPTSEYRKLGPVKVVAELWKEWVDDLVGMMVQRDEQLRRFGEEGDAMCD